MKRLIVAAGLAVAALSLPATAALADGYVQRPAAKPKPKPKPKPTAKKHHHKAARHHEAASYSFERMEKVERSYYEESDHHRYGPVYSYSETYINPSRGCYAHAPCTKSSGPPIQDYFFGSGMAGGVGYGVDGGPIYSGHGMYIMPGGGFRSHHAHGWSGASSSAHGMSHGYYGGQGYGRPGSAYPPAYGHPGHGMPGTPGMNPGPGRPWGPHPGAQPGQLPAGPQPGMRPGQLPAGPQPGGPRPGQQPGPNPGQPGGN